MKNLYLVIILVVASFLLFVFVWPQAVNKIFKYLNIEISVPEAPFSLGLDLLGGAHLLYEADLSLVEEVNRSEAMEGIRDVIERRVNFFGVSEPVVQVSGENRLIIELAGITDVNQAIQMIGETPFLEFKEEVTNYSELVSEFQKKIDSGQATELDSLALNDQLFSSTGLNGKHVKRAQVSFEQQTGQPQVSLQLSDEGAELFGEITKRNIGKRVAIFFLNLLVTWRT